MVLVTGDTHGEFFRFKSRNFPEGKTLTKDDIIIIAGDFGGIWSQSDEELYWLNWLADKPWTTCFIDGNHENFTIIDQLTEETKFGAPVGVVQCDNNNIYHLKRGNIYTFGEDNVFVFGGGLSIDKQYRTEGTSWWAREYPSVEELDRGWANIINGQPIDYVISHVPPTSAMFRVSPFEGSYNKKFDVVSHHLQDMFLEIKNNPNFKKWYHGHMHYDLQCREEFVGLHYEMIRLGANLKHYETEMTEPLVWSTYDEENN